MPWPDNAIDPIPHLQEPRRDGLKCSASGCQYIGGQRQAIQKHCQQVHQWVDRVQWETHLCQFDRPQLQTWVRKPEKEGEGGLWLICKAFEWMIRECQSTATIDVVGSEVLFIANRKEFHKDPEMRLSGWMDIDTAIKYCGVWKGVLCYLFRSQEVEKDDRPAYILSKCIPRYMSINSGEQHEERTSAMRSGIPTRRLKRWQRFKGAFYSCASPYWITHSSTASTRAC